MRPEELMIGDYAQVNRDGLCINKDTIVEIREIDANNTFNTHIGSASCRPLDDIQYENGIWCDDLSPIPLTTEILEKNGFIKRYDYQWEYRDNSCAIVVNIAPQIEIDGEALGTPPINVNLEGALFDINITSDMCVHELQHALRLCGIDKEIEP